MNNIYILNQYGDDYEKNAVIYKANIGKGKGISYELTDGSNTLHKGRAYGNPVNGDVRVDLTDICAGFMPEINFITIPQGLSEFNNRKHFNFIINTLDDNGNVTKTVTETFILALSNGGSCYNDKAYDKYYITDQVYNNTLSTMTVRFEVVMTNMNGYNTIVTNPAMNLAAGKVAIFKDQINKGNYVSVTINKYVNGTKTSVTMPIVQSKSRIESLVYLNDKGLFQSLPILIDKSMYKKSYTDKTYLSGNKTIKYDTKFIDQLSFKTPYLTDREWAMAGDLIGSKHIYLVDKGIKQVSTDITNYEYKTFSNTKQFNQLTGDLNFMYENKRYL